MRSLYNVFFKVMNRLMFQIGLIVFSTTVFSQNIIIPPSPNVASISSGIQSQLSQYTGKANVHIPIYTIETGNLSIPISLSYNTGGIKVNEIASWCGLGWNLNAGGLVSRSVVGLPDETPGVGYNAFNILYDNPSAETTLYQNNDLEYSDYAKFALGKADGEPDQYFFSLPDGSGKIKKSWNHGYSTQADQKFSVSNISKDQSFGSWANGINATNICGNNFNSSNPISIDEWTLKDGYGNSYQFSDKEQSSSHLRSNYSGPSAYRPYYMTDTCYKGVNSWHLSSITPPNGGINNSVTFEYDSIPLVYDLPSNITLMSRQSGPTFPSLSGITYSDILQTVQIKRLSAIYFPGGAVKFIPTSFTRADFVNDKALERIVIENEKGDIIRQYVFNYKYLLGNQLLRFDSAYASAGSGLLYYWNYYFPEGAFDGRLILESITEQDKEGNSINEGISFNYIHDIGLPDRGSLSTDYWGFYNGFNDPPFIFNSGEFQEMAPNSKTPNLMYAAQGSLKKINYPSGSSTYFTYSEKYAKFPDYAGTGFLPFYSIAGGLNVVTMVTTDSLTDQKYSVSYLYEEGAANSTPYNERTIAIGTQTYKSISLNSHYPLTTTQGSTVGYGKVTEEEFKYEISSSDFIDKGKTENYFTNPETDPDEIYSIDQPAIYYPGAPINDKDWKRGLLKEKKIYSSDSIFSGNYTLKYNLINEYGYIHDTLGKAMSGIIYTHAENSVNNQYRLIPYRLYKGRVELRNSLEKKYEDGEVSSSSINIIYNKRNYLPAVTTTIIPSSEIVRETQSYASDVDHNNYNLYPSLLVESLTFRQRPGEFILMEGQLNNYDAFGNITSVSRLNKDTAITDPTGFKYANMTAGNIPSWENDPVGYLQPDRRYYKELTLKRNIENGGSIKEQQSVSGLSETFIWGYTKDHAQYPVAKIIGVNHNIASSLINQSLLDSAVYYSDARIRIELNKLRINLPDARITTYTYAPLIGVTSETDENGKTIYYEYDSFGRLIIVKDDQFNVLKQICYNSDGSNGDCFESYYYSSEVSNSFAQINCDGVPGNSIIYKVPKGAYSSTISQANANQKATDDLNANGQAYANSLRKCALYFNIEKSQSFTRNNCIDGPGNSISYVVPANNYASTISQADANQKATNDINDNGQAYANTHATCPQIIPYARLKPVNVYTDWYTDITYADIEVEFFRDYGCTIPYSVNNLTLYVAISSNFSDNTYNYTDPYLEFNCNGSSQMILPNAIISGYDLNFYKTVTSRVFLLPPVGAYSGIF